MSEQLLGPKLSGPGTAVPSPIGSTTDRALPEQSYLKGRVWAEESFPTNIWRAAGDTPRNSRISAI